MRDSLQQFENLDDATLRALTDSIKENGRIMVPILVDQYGRIIDGHHRRKIATELGIECPSESVYVEDDEEALELARSLNEDRRQLLDIDERRRRVARKRAEGMSERAIAQVMGIGQATVHRDLVASGQSDSHESLHNPRSERQDHASRLNGQGKTQAEIAEELGVNQATVSRDLKPRSSLADRLADLAGVDDSSNSELADGDRATYTPRNVPTKPDLGDGISHPARYTDRLLPVFAKHLVGYRRVLDPFAGTGKIHQLQPEHVTIGVELEPEWARLHPDTIIGDALDLTFADASFDAICTSPTYGNRLADHHNASDPEKRRSYTHDLGRKLSDNNSGAMHWGDDYRRFHTRAWAEAERVLKPGGRFIVNIKNHIRSGDEQLVSEWHLHHFLAAEYRLAAAEQVEAPSMRAGSNAAARIDFEWVFVLDKPAA